jgi:hypothetical protein
MANRTATTTGSLNVIPDCYIDIPVTLKSQIFAGGRVKTITNNITHTVKMNNLPDISDTKNAIYNPEGIIGRSFPLYTYSHSGDRSLNIQIHFFAVDPEDVQDNIQDLRAIQSAVYPREGIGGAPYRPPAICRISCGSLLAGNPNSSSGPEPLCCSLQSYSVKFPTEVAWEESTYMPYRFDVDTSWLTVYTSDKLPFASRIYKSGR